MDIKNLEKRLNDNIVNKLKHLKVITNDQGIKYLKNLTENYCSNMIEEYNPSNNIFPEVSVDLSKGKIIINVVLNSYSTYSNKLH